MDGLVLLDKPSGPTSHDCVSRLRRLLETKKIGHFGTLDPFARGLLLAGIGKATRLFPYFGLSDKAYMGTIRLGMATDTYDRTGRPDGPEAETLPTREAVVSAMARFLGEQMQLAPPFSAKKLDGKPFYAYARQGIEIERRATRVRIDRFDLRSYAPPDLDFEVFCSAGTYVRALAHDLGTALGCGAHLFELTRTASGSYRLSDARTFEEIELAVGRGNPDAFLTPMEELLPGFSRADLTSAGRDRVKNGRPVVLSDPGQVARFQGETGGGDIIRLFDPEGRLAALARAAESGASPFLVLI